MAKRIVYLMVIVALLTAACAQLRPPPNPPKRRSPRRPKPLHRAAAPAQPLCLSLNPVDPRRRTRKDAHRNSQRLYGRKGRFHFRCGRRGR